jgi:VIT1/CCC1 family predicted Fe2+/Mn2+ transporter
MRETTSLVDLGRQLLDEARDLARKEIELAKVEVLDLVKTNAVAIGLFAGALILALVMFVLSFPFTTQFIVAWCLVGFWLIVVVILALIGKSKLRFEAPPKTMSTLKGDIEWAKGQIHSNGKS